VYWGVCVSKLPRFQAFDDDGSPYPLLGTGWAMESGAVLRDLRVGIREMKI